MENNLSINAEVLEQMAAIAAKEVEGVAGLDDKAVDIKRIIGSGKLFKGAIVTEKNGAVTVDLYITVKQSVHVKEVAETVQKNVKEKLQSMTGSAITRVNVNVADVLDAEKTE